ncbi:MAG: hypothetical protein KF687_16780 [Cyclobacteriaceae bacterium]|nr:hypothetical protein [Cyclobacteriaceae bacterium]
MKKVLNFIAFGIVVTLSACNFSVGTNANMVSGLSTSWNGLNAESVYFVDEQNQPITSKQVSMNTECSFVFEGISNFTLKDGNVFPGMTLTVLNESGEEVVVFDDMLASYTEGLSPNDASVLQAALTVGTPMQVSETYTITARVFDKQNADAELIGKIKVTIVD